MPTKDFSGIRNSDPLPDPQNVNLPADCEDLLEDYIESISSMLDEIEQAALAYEAGSDREDNAAVIRRGLHKIKGESSMMGIEEMSELCHQTEFAFEEMNEKQRPNVILRFKDWVNTAMYNLSTRV